MSFHYFIIPGILLFIGAIILNYFNNKRDALNGHINHSRALKYKILSCIPCGVCFALAPIENAKWAWILVFTSWMVGSWFLCVFNGIWGLSVYNNIWARSTATGKNKGWFDRMVERWKDWEYIAFQLILIITSTFMYSKLFD